jgi:hypothetical protein
MKQIKLLSLFTLFLNFISCHAQSNCVYSEASITDIFLKKSKNVITYTWDNKLKEGKAILKNGGIVLVKKWACDHYGVSSSMLLPKNSDVFPNWKNYLLEMSTLVNLESTHQMLKQKLETINQLNNKLIIDGKYEIDLSDNTYPEYFVNIYELSDCYVFSIFQYRN